MPRQAHGGIGADRMRRFDVILDPCDSYEIWDNEVDMPVLAGGRLAFRRWHEAVRHALQSEQDCATGAPSLAIVGRQARARFRPRFSKNKL